MEQQALVTVNHEAESSLTTQNILSREQIDLIKRTVAHGATDDELALFLHVCQRTGLDPLARQIHAVKRWNRAENREVMSIQTGIDGYRLTAARTGEHMGTDDAVFDTEDEPHPNKASVTVYRLRNGQVCSFTASARWSEYVQTTREGTPNAMWGRMPFLMLGKCAEALALRKAFPAELSGLYTHEEMMQADRANAEPRAELPRQAPAPAAPAKPGRISDGQRKRLFSLGKEHGLSTEDLKTFLKSVHAIESTADVPSDQYDLICQQITDGAVREYLHNPEGESK